jgi:hypothetical protein
MSLLERCEEFVRSLQSSVGDFRPEDAANLRDFVHSEVGRAASEVLEDSAPVVLYLATEQDRADLIAAIHEACPGMIERKWP